MACCCLHSHTVLATCAPYQPAILPAAKGEGEGARGNEDLPTEQSDMRSSLSVRGLDFMHWLGDKTREAVIVLYVQVSHQQQLKNCTNRCVVVYACGGVRVWWCTCVV